MFRTISVLVIILTAAAASVVLSELQVTTTENNGRQDRYENRTETSTHKEEPNNLQADQYEYLTVDSIFTYTDTDGKQNIGVGCESEYRNFTASALKSNKSCEKLVRARFGLRRGRIFQCNFTDGKVLHYVSYGVDEAGFIVTDLTHFPLVTTSAVDADSKFSAPPSADENRNYYISIDKVFTYTDTDGKQIVGVGCISEYLNFIQIASMRNKSGENLVRAKFKVSYSAENPIFQCRFIVGELLRFVSYEVDKEGFIVTALKNYPLLMTRSENKIADENISFDTRLYSPVLYILGPYEYLSIDSIFTYTDTDGNKKVGVGCESDYRNITENALLSNASGEKLVRFVDKIEGLFQCNFVDASKELHYVTYIMDEAGVIVTNLTHLPLVTTTTSKNGTADDGKGSCEFRNNTLTSKEEPSDFHPYRCLPIGDIFTYRNPDGKKIVGVGCISAYHYNRTRKVVRNMVRNMEIRSLITRKPPVKRPVFWLYNINISFGIQFQHSALQDNFTTSASMSNESGEKLVRLGGYLSKGREFHCEFSDEKGGFCDVKYIVDEEGFLILIERGCILPISHAPLVVATLLGAG